MGGHSHSLLKKKELEKGEKILPLLLMFYGIFHVVDAEGGTPCDKALYPCKSAQIYLGDLTFRLQYFGFNAFNFWAF